MNTALDLCPFCRYTPCVGRGGGCGLVQAQAALEHLEAALLALETLQQAPGNGLTFVKKAIQGVNTARWQLDYWKANR